MLMGDETAVASDTFEGQTKSCVKKSAIFVVVGFICFLPMGSIEYFNSNISLGQIAKAILLAVSLIGMVCIGISFSYGVFGGFMRPMQRKLWLNGFRFEPESYQNAVLKSPFRKFWLWWLWIDQDGNCRDEHNVNSFNEKK